MSLLTRQGRARRAVIFLVVLASLLGGSAAMAQADNVGSLREAREAAEARDQARLQSFLDDQEALEAALAEARAEHQAAAEQQTALAEQQQRKRCTPKRLPRVRKSRAKRSPRCWQICHGIAKRYAMSWGVTVG